MSNSQIFHRLIMVMPSF